MTEYQTSRTNPHMEVDPLMRIRLLELQIAAVADAVRAIADAIEAGDTTGVAKRVDNLLLDARVPHV
ncbi:MAG TPA: hypothetical protein VFM54_11160 [Micromonosporaceae bacterium]|nr:hypothetical protein [Micromonosporaceae bacterium]